MWGLACHRGLWGMFRDNGDSTSTPLLHLQGLDLQKDPQTPAHDTSRSLPFPAACPRAWLESLVSRQSFTISPKCCRMALPQFREAL